MLITVYTKLTNKVGNKKMKDEISNLLQKEMDRKSFLKHVGVGFVAMTGIAALLKTLNGVNGNAPRQDQAGGYGSSAYGGGKKTAAVRSNG